MASIVFAKTANPAHMAENCDIFDFELDADDMAKMTSLDCGKRYFTMTLEEQEANLGGFKPAE